MRDRLLLLLLALSTHPLNCEKLINPDCLELLVDLLTTAHTTDPELRATASLAAGGASLLLLTNAPPGFSVPKDGDREEVAENANAKESLKVRRGGRRGRRRWWEAHPPPPSPLLLRQVWHYRALKADLAPGEKSEKGPYSLQDMQRLGEMKKLLPSSLVWAQVGQ